jgi:hypothetical protein
MASNLNRKKKRLATSDEALGSVFFHQRPLAEGVGQVNRGDVVQQPTAQAAVG